MDSGNRGALCKARCLDLTFLSPSASDLVADISMLSRWDESWHSLETSSWHTVSQRPKHGAAFIARYRWIPDMLWVAWPGFGFWAVCAHNWVTPHQREGPESLFRLNIVQSASRYVSWITAGLQLWGYICKLTWISLPDSILMAWLLHGYLHALQ